MIVEVSDTLKALRIRYECDDYEIYAGCLILRKDNKGFKAWSRNTWLTAQIVDEDEILP